MNMLKTAGLMTWLTLIPVYGGAYLVGRSGMTTALIFALVMNFFTTHPPREERVARLEAMRRGN